MKALYAVQATGNGHISRALQVYPELAKRFDTDVLLSGIQGDIPLPFDVKYRFHGLSFIFGTRGGVDYWETAKTLKPFRFWSDMRSLDLSEYDVIISDFEPVSTWAARRQNKFTIALSHQAAFLSKNTPRHPSGSFVVEWLFKHYAPAKRAIGLHFESYDSFIMPPVIRPEISSMNTTYVDNKVLVYLPAYGDDQIIPHLLPHKSYEFLIFSKHSKESYTVDNVSVSPVGREKWISALSVTPFAIVGAGFQSLAEMLFLKKNIMIVPMTNQYEQLCNATALEVYGFPIIYDLKKQLPAQIGPWLEEKNADIFDRFQFTTDAALLVDRVEELIHEKNM